jgi:low temperature requirement protein LtrA
MATTVRATEAQGATFVELFFDLVFVFAVTQVTAAVRADLTAAGLLRAVVVFWLIWWAWTQFTWTLNAANTERSGIRLLTLGATAVAFLMALTVPDVYGSAAWWFALSYILVRLIGIAGQWWVSSGDLEWHSAVRCREHSAPPRSWPPSPSTCSRPSVPARVSGACTRVTSPSATGCS